MTASAAVDSTTSQPIWADKARNSKDKYLLGGWMCGEGTSFPNVRLERSQLQLPRALVGEVVVASIAVEDDKSPHLLRTSSRMEGL